MRTLKIPFNIHRRIPLLRRPFYQRDIAIAEKDRLLAELDRTNTAQIALRAETQRLEELYRLSHVYHRPVEQTSGVPSVALSDKADDLTLIARIIAAYRTASVTDVGKADSFWLTYFADLKRADHEIIHSGNVDAVAALLRNPSQTKLFVGFDELHDHNGLSNHGISHVISSAGWLYDALLRFAEAIGARRLYYPEELTHDEPPPEIDELLRDLDRATGFRVMFPNPFPDEVGLATSRGVLSFRAIQSLHQAYRIAELVRKNPGARILEIGGGLGRTAYYAWQFGIRDYTIIDLPLTNVAQGYFLGRTLGEDTVSFYGEKSSSIRILPPTEFLDASDRYDLVVNVDSLTEMGRDTAWSYCQAINTRANRFLSINHERNSLAVRDLCAEIGMDLSARAPYWLRRGYLDEVFVPSSNSSPRCSRIPDPGSNYHHILLACLPKSGSTYLASILGNLPDFSSISLVSTFGKREQEIEPELMLSNSGRNYVAQHHVRFSEATSSLIQAYNLKAVVLVRDIFDAVISMRDHMRNESVVFPMAYASPDFGQWEDARLEGFIVDMIIPWYFNFYLSWLETEDKLVLTYEDLNRDPFSVVSRILHQCDISCSDEEIRTAISKSHSQATRKNRAIIGRGQNLAESARQSIYKMARYYDGVDFSPLGIDL